MTEIPQPGPQEPEKLLESSAHILLKPDTVEVLEKGGTTVPYELPKPPVENHGLVAVLDIGGKMPDANYSYGEGVPPVQESDMKMLLVVDLRENDGKNWVLGSEVPAGAAYALVDAKGIEIDSDGCVTRGVHFMKPGDAFTIGRGVPQARERFDIEHAMAVTSRHLDLAVDGGGRMLVRDKGSTNGTIVSTGEYARQAVNEIGEHHLHHARFKAALGGEAVEAAHVTLPAEAAKLIRSVAPVSPSEQPASPAGVDVRDKLAGVKPATPPETEQPAAPEAAGGLFSSGLNMPPDTFTGDAAGVQGAGVGAGVRLNMGPGSKPSNVSEATGGLNTGQDTFSSRRAPSSREQVLEALRDPGSTTGTQSSPETDRTVEANTAAATKRLNELLSQNGMGGGALGELVRQYGSDIKGLRQILEDPGKNRAFVLGVMRLFDDQALKAKFGERVLRNEEVPVKLPHLHGGRDKMPSQEYVAELVRDMLVGNYQLDRVVFDGKRSDGNGQHRGAALDVLEHFSRQQVANEVEKVQAESEVLRRLFYEVGASAQQVLRVLDGVGTVLEEISHNSNQGRLDTDQLDMAERLVRQARGTLISSATRVLSQESQLGEDGVDQATVDTTREIGLRLNSVVSDLEDMYQHRGLLGSILRTGREAVDSRNSADFNHFADYARKNIPYIMEHLGTYRRTLQEIMQQVQR